MDNNTLRSLVSSKGVKIIGGPNAGRIGIMSYNGILEHPDFVKAQVFLYPDINNHAEFSIEDIENIEIREA